MKSAQQERDAIIVYLRRIGFPDIAQDIEEGLHCPAPDAEDLYDVFQGKVAVAIGLDPAVLAAETIRARERFTRPIAEDDYTRRLNARITVDKGLLFLTFDPISRENTTAKEWVRRYGDLSFKAPKMWRNARRAVDLKTMLSWMNPSYSREEAEAIFAGRETLTVLEVAESESALDLLLRDHWLSEKSLRLLAVEFADNAFARTWSTPNKLSLAACEVATRFANGNASVKELADAQDDAKSTARLLAADAASEAAGNLKWDSVRAAGVAARTCALDVGAAMRAGLIEPGFAGPWHLERTLAAIEAEPT